MFFVFAAIARLHLNQKPGNLRAQRSTAELVFAMETQDKPTLGELIAEASAAGASKRFFKT